MEKEKIEVSFTISKILELVREEITDAYSKDLRENEFREKLYIILGIVESALRREQNSE